MGKRPGAVLTHQVVIRLRNRKTIVSCQCRAVLGKHSRNPPDDFYEAMPVVEGETMWQTYNRPENHWAEFTDKDRVQA